MKLPFSLFLALRYLKPKRTFVSVITLISVAGVMIGVAALIVVLAVMTGFDHELRRKVLGFEAHLVVGSRGGVMSDWEPVREQLDRTPGIEASAPFVMGPVLLEFENQFMAGKMRGILLESEERITKLGEFVKKGALDLDGDKCVMGRELAASLGVTVGDRVLFHGPGNLREVMHQLKKAETKDPDAKSVGQIRELIQPAELEVTGIFETGRSQYDAEYTLVPLHIAQEIYGMAGDIHGVTLRTKDPYWAETFKPELRAQLGEVFSVTSWIDQNKQLFEAIGVERVAMFFILLLIVGVAGFGIMNTLITLSTLKRKDIGVQKALGARPSQVMSVFLIHGGVVGILGVLSGLALGFTLLAWRNEFKAFLSRVTGMEIFPKAIYQFSQIPAELMPRDIVIICVSAFIASVVAAVLPALFAAWTDPVKALREE